MLDFIFKDEAKNIEDYCWTELGDRLNRAGLNPGNSYKVRLDLWQKLMSKAEGDKFDYTLFGEDQFHKWGNWTMPLLL